MQYHKLHNLWSWTKKIISVFGPFLFWTMKGVSITPKGGTFVLKTFVMQGLAQLHEIFWLLFRLQGLILVPACRISLATQK